MTNTRKLAVMAAGAVLVLAACSPANPSGSSSAANPSGSSSAANPSGSSSATSENFRIAFLSQSASNTYLSETWEAMQDIAAEHGATVTQFDAAFDVAKQQQQLQNVVASGQYDGVIISAITDAVSADVTAAAAAGLKVVVVGAVLGTDLDTSDPQVKGVDLSVVAPPTSYGKGLGTLTKEACEGIDPCRVVYFYGIKGTPTDTAWHESFTETIGDNPSIDIVAEAEGKFGGPDVALAAMQNVLQSTPEFEVVVGVDQAMQGVQIALEQVGKLDNVAIIGVGGSTTAVKEVSAGNWFGGFMTAPQTEGRLAMTGMLELLGNGKLSTPAGINPLSEVPNGGLFTKENVNDVEPQWKG